MAKKHDPVMQIVRCNVCGEFSIKAGGLAYCPSGCRPDKMQVAATLRVPYKGVQSALRSATTA